MMKDLDEFFDDSLPLPIGGKTYHVPGVSARDGLWAQRLVQEIERAREEGDVDRGKLDDGDERLLYQRMLGPVFDEMIDDGVSWPKIGHAGMTAFFWATQSRETAEEYWHSGGKTSPEAEGSAEGSTPNRASRRASAAAARTTQKRASTSGTKAPKSTAKKPGSRSKKS